MIDDSVIKCVSETTAQVSNWWNGPLIGGAFTILGTGLGVVLGFFSTRRAQHEQWLRDSRKQEWRELLGALASSFATVTRLERHGVAIGPGDQRALDDAHDSAENTIRDRIFIAPEVGDMNIGKSWRQIINASRRGDYENANLRFHELTSDIVLAALKPSTHKAGL